MILWDKLDNVKEDQDQGNGVDYKYIKIKKNWTLTKRNMVKKVEQFCIKKSCGGEIVSNTAYETKMHAN